MKKIVLLLCLVLSFMFISSTDIKAQLLDFKHGGLTRQYIYYAPPKLPANAPLVVVMHGYTGSAPDIRNYSGMNAVANANGFAVCYPQGSMDEWGNRFFNVGYDFHGDETVDDLDFLIKLVEYLQIQHNLSSENIFATGLSNGGDMSYLLACEASTIFKAIAPVAGMMMQSIADNCTATNPMPVFEIHGTEDDVTYYDGDPNNNDGWGAYPSIPYIIDFWVNLNDCDDATTIALPNADPNDGSYVESEKYLNGINGNEVWLYRVVGGGHDWPGAWGNMDINSSEKIWIFFSNFITETTSANELPVTNKSMVAPNPASTYLTIKVDKKYIGTSLSLLDYKGKEIKTTTIASSNVQLAINSLISGLYYLRINSDTPELIKFVKE